MVGSGSLGPAFFYIQRAYLWFSMMERPQVAVQMLNYYGDNIMHHKLWYIQLNKMYRCHIGTY